MSYVCAAGRLTRFWGYDPAVGVTAATPRALLATRVSACSFDYQPGVGGLVSMTLSLSLAGETIRLHANTQLSNQP